MLTQKNWKTGPHASSLLRILFIDPFNFSTNKTFIVSFEPTGNNDIYTGPRHSNSSAIHIFFISSRYLELNGIAESTVGSSVYIHWLNQICEWFEGAWGIVCRLVKCRED